MYRFVLVCCVAASLICALPAIAGAHAGHLHGHVDVVDPRSGVLEQLEPHELSEEQRATAAAAELFIARTEGDEPDQRGADYSRAANFPLAPVVRTKFVLVGGQGTTRDLVMARLALPDTGFTAQFAGSGGRWVDFQGANGGEPDVTDWYLPGQDVCQGATIGNSESLVWPTVERDGYDLVVYIFAGPNCNYAGAGGTGSAWASFDTEVTEHGYDHIESLDRIVTHEVGHGLSVDHSNAWKCFDAYAGQPPLPWNPACTWDEYGSAVDQMGIGSFGISELSMLTGDMRWVPRNRIAEVRASQTITLSGQWPVAGPHSVVVPTRVVDSHSDELDSYYFPDADSTTRLHENVMVGGVGVEWNTVTYDPDWSAETPELVTEYGVAIRAMPGLFDVATGSTVGMNARTAQFVSQRPGDRPSASMQLFLPGESFTVPSYLFHRVPDDVMLDKVVASALRPGLGTTTVTVLSASAAEATIRVDMAAVPARVTRAMPVRTVAGGLRLVPKIVIAKPRTLRLRSVLSVPKAYVGFTKPTYQWLRNGKPIPRAKQRGYRLTKLDRGRRLSVRVTFVRIADRKRFTRTTAAVAVPRALR